MNYKKIKISKTLCYLLRHGAVKEQIPIRQDGYVSLANVISFLNKKNYNVTQQIIFDIVQNNQKKRYQIQNIQKSNGQTELFIRACQGHSIKQITSQELLQPIFNPNQYQTVVHGTFKQFWDSIYKQGLKKMNRNHIHFAIGYPKNKNVISGMKGNCDIYIELDMNKAMQDGIRFYISKNNVILCEGVNGILQPKYFKMVKNKNGQTLFTNNDLIN